MKLVHKKVPIAFLNALPEGIKYVKKNGKDFLVIEKISCPNGHSLMENSVCLHGEPSVKIKAKISDAKGSIYVDAYWGSHHKLYSFIPNTCDQTQWQEITCPTCGTSLIIDSPCEQDGCNCTKAIQFTLPNKQNKITVCAGFGCPGHNLQIVDIPQQISEQVSVIHYFGMQEDDMFLGI